jgi:predicted metalloprotease with PDZ domain
VVTAIHGEFRVPTDTLFAMARSITCGQRDLWGDHSQPFYSIVITARDRLRAGASYLNAFACFARPDSRADQLALLLAHEMMHAWVPRKVQLVPGAGEEPTVEFSTFHNVRYDWFHEGFTEYLARLVLVRIGLVTQEWFVERLNDDLARLAVHPYRATPTAEFEQAVRLKRFNNFHQRISYHRGTALAFNLDAALRRSSADKHSLIDAVRRLLVLAKDSAKVTPNEFASVFRDLGVDVSHAVQQQALRGAPIVPDSTGLGPDWVLRFRDVPGFEPGFDVASSMVNNVAIGVQTDGSAYAAGLREGMRIERVVNGMRSADDWKADQPLTVTVREGENERTITFVATRGTVRVPYFEKR